MVYMAICSRRRRGLALMLGASVLAMGCAGAAGSHDVETLRDDRAQDRAVFEAQPPAAELASSDATLEEAYVPTSPPNEPPATIADAWRALPFIEGHGCDEEDLFFDYGDDGGMRTLFCRTLTVFSWKSFLELAPFAPFLRGPHPEGKLNLHSPEEFGHYDPDFVQWAVDTLVPAAQDPRLREATQPIYDRTIRDLARTYWETHRAISSDRGWQHVQAERYRRAAERGRVPMEFHDMYELLGDANARWGGHDPNHVRTATMWWLRRHIDGTDSLWAVGLERLIRTYDRAWFVERRGFWRGNLPKPPRTVPHEYKPVGGAFCSGRASCARCAGPTGGAGCVVTPRPTCPSGRGCRPITALASTLSYFAPP